MQEDHQDFSDFRSEVQEDRKDFRRRSEVQEDRKDYQSSVHRAKAQEVSKNVGEVGVYNMRGQL